MADPMNGPNTRCPWCSASLPDPTVEKCPSCAATLVGAPGSDGEIRGVTTLDTEAILRARADIARPRSGILSFITGNSMSDTGSGPANPESLAPPAAEVRREMVRLQLEAERADLTAETVALKADVLAQRGIHVSQLGDSGTEAVADDGSSGGGEADAAADGAPDGATPDAATPDGATPDTATPDTATPDAQAPADAVAPGSWPAELDPDAERAGTEPPSAP